ncbi:MAG: T9SS type A sorting domain-containing protein [Candidatus Electryonea clarkiae]|nr:T9SS type A sorting domain-containing protein [Candidatus Electryonea clarkiae]MDP8287847.1 T9SS type A sorting domain-containing protein [Candidatus Electryonea clarkiae]
MRTAVKSVFSFLAFFVFLPSLINAQIEFTTHVISDEYDAPFMIITADINSDGDIDLLSSSYEGDEVTWWENDGDRNFTQHTIDNNFDGPTGVFASDIDGDGDVDILATASIGDDVTWWENDGNEDFTEHRIIDDYDGAYSIFAIDLDNDEDVDILASSTAMDGVTWWENDGAENFTENLICDSEGVVLSLFAVDMDGDDDVDIIGPSSAGLNWWENDGDQGFTNNTVERIYQGVYSVYATDVNGDGNMDILSVAANEDSITWWENDGNEDFTEHNIASDYDNPLGIYAADIRGNGEVDVMSVALNDNEITWWENDGDEDFNEHTLDNNFRGAGSIHAADFDNDEDIDIVGVAFWEDEVTWYENDLDPHSPSHFSLLSPEDQAGINEFPIEFEWETAVDNDEGDEVTYSIFLSEDEDFTDPLELDAGTDTTLALEELEDDTNYWWKVSAGDDNGHYRWSNEVWSFSMEVSDPPANFSLSSPDSGATSLTSEIDLSWTAATDPDQGDLIVYDVYVSTDPDDPGEPVVTDLDETGYTFDAPGQTVYYWIVHARDTNTDGRWADETWSFEVDIPDPPTAFNLLLPADDSIIPETDPYLVTTTWERSSDPDPGEEVTYNLILFVAIHDTGNMARVLNYYDLMDPIFTINVPAEVDVEYWNSLDVAWHVEAVSGHDTVRCNRPFTFSLEPNSLTEEQVKSELPDRFEIASLYPNPFNPSLNITVGIPLTSSLKVSIYNLLGNQVAVLADDRYNSGWHKIKFNAQSLPSGIYFIHASVPGKMDEVRKIVLMK